MSAFGSFGANQSQQQQPTGGLFATSTQNQPAQNAGGLFGNTQQQPQQQTGGLFANTQQQTQQPTGTLFGNAQQQPQPSGGLFGNTQQQQPQQNAAGGLFGGAATSNNANNAPSGGLFGNTTTQNAGAGGGLFGNAGTAGTGTTGGGLFGNASNTSTNTGGLFSNTQNTNTTNPSGGLFSNTATANTNTGGGGLFGNTSNANTANPTGGLFSNTSGGLFGNTSTNTTSTGGGLFGNPTSNTSNTGSGGLFGSTGTNTSNAGGGLFGNPSTNTGGGLFGNTASTSTAPSGGLFGNQSQNNQSSLFGGPKPAGSLFGQSTQPQQQQQQQQQQGSSLFGTLNQPPAQPTGGLFGTSTLGASTLGTSALGGAFGGAGLGNSILSSRATVIPVQSQPDPQTQFITLLQRIEAVKNAWDPNSPQCRFQQYFYNLVDPAQVRMYGRPANATNEDLWQKALRENPDPSCMVPVLAVGFDDLQQRVDAQTNQTNQHQEKLKELKTRIDALSQRHEVTNSARLRRAAALQMQLTHRVLRVVQHLHLLIPALRSSSIRPEEEALRAALEEIDEEIRRPGGMGKMRAKLNELWALVDSVRAARERIRQEGTVEWAVVDEDGLAQIAQILAEEQAGLAHVTTILQRDLKDLSIILGVPRKQEDPDVLMGSASALRSSMIR